MKTALAFWKGSTVSEASRSTQLRQLFKRSCLISAAVLCLSAFQHEAQRRLSSRNAPTPFAHRAKPARYIGVLPLGHAWTAPHRLPAAQAVKLDMRLAMTRTLQAATSRTYSLNPRITGQSTTRATCGTTGLRQQVRSKSRQSLCPPVAFKRVARSLFKPQSPSMRARLP